MADQNQNDRTEEQRDVKGDPNQDPNKKRQAGAEQDDVAEDRNLSGSSTWLTLPDQPKDDQSENS